MIGSCTSGILGRSKLDDLPTVAEQVVVGLPAAGPARFSPKQRGVYELNKVACSASSPKRIARKYAIKGGHPFLIARRISKLARPVFQDAALEGCLAGFGIK